jgi:hypothetical protein
MEVEEKYEVENGLLGLKRDLIIKLAGTQKNEDNLRNIICLCKETSKYKKHFLFNIYRFFPPILSLRYGHPERNGNEYEIVGNKILVSKEFMNQFIIDYKMYENTGIYQISGKYYPRTYYSLGIGCIEYVNEIYNFMRNNRCCFYHISYVLSFRSFLQVLRHFSSFFHGLHQFVLSFTFLNN